MKFIIILCLTLFNLSSTSTWLKDMEEAKKAAKESNKLILLNFSGSDWCVPCMKLEKNVFEMQDFTDYANAKLVLVNADFPRRKENKLSKEQVQKNEALADKYNPRGGFPHVLLMDAEGNVIKEWLGYNSATTAKDFVHQLELCL